MQVIIPFKIKLNFSCTQYNGTPSISLYSYNTNSSFIQSVYHGKPTSFEWIEFNTKSDSPKLLKWIEEEFKPLFEYDPMLWLASVGTAPVELRPYLTPFHKET